MYENYKDGVTTNDSNKAYKMAEKIAQAYHNTDVTTEKLYNSGGYPLNKGAKYSVAEIEKNGSLIELLKSDPIYANYTRLGAAHMVLVTGAIIAPGHPQLVISNNPWNNEKTVETYSDFKFLELQVKKEIIRFKLNCVYLINDN